MHNASSDIDLNEFEYDDIEGVYVYNLQENLNPPIHNESIINENDDDDSINSNSSTETEEQEENDIEIMHPDEALMRCKQTMNKL